MLLDLVDVFNESSSLSSSSMRNEVEEVLWTVKAPTFSWIPVFKKILRNFRTKQFVCYQSTRELADELSIVETKIIFSRQLIIQDAITFSSSVVFAVDGFRICFVGFWGWLLKHRRKTLLVENRRRFDPNLCRILELRSPHHIFE